MQAHKEYSLYQEKPLGFFIGRMEPPHVGHFRIMEKALKECSDLIIFVGSSHVARSPKNPWTFYERSEMILSGLEDRKNDLKPVTVYPLEDVPYGKTGFATGDAEWAQQVIDVIEALRGNRSVRLYGCNKDSSSYYLNLFPYALSLQEQTPDLNATDIRQLYFKGDAEWHDYLTRSTIEFLHKFKKTEDFQDLVADLEKYKTIEHNYPWPIIGLTVDAIVEHKDRFDSYFLLVERGKAPGKGLFACPGGFLNPDESLLKGCLRELQEETGLVWTEQPIKSRRFDFPGRSLRGRIITETFHFRCNAIGRPPVQGADDAAWAGWVSSTYIRNNPQLFFDDHWHMLMWAMESQ